MRDKIVIDLNKLVVAKNKAGNFSINGEGENLLIELKEARSKIEEMYHDALAKIHEQALEYDPNSKAIDGKSIRVTFSQSGAKYVAPSLDNVDAKFKHIETKLNTDEIEEYYEKHLELPKGVKTNEERSISIRLSVRNNDNNSD